MSEDKELWVERRGAVLWLTLQREQRRNALHAALVAALTRALAEAERQPELRAIVLTGAGEQAFCAGADLQSGGSFKLDHSQPYQGFADLLRQARRCTLPLIARVNGACMA
ncbi:MAG: enoyl-CoA hydratase/isomerase family protein, partial [Paucibacter sp.]|nr:enoyl-CoA hydratase/isomerase family protein [Roseateles sp.]